MKTFIEYLEEKKLSTEDRDNLPNKSFAFVVDGKGKYPLNDANHVRSAITFFNKCPADKKKLLARKIAKKCKEFGIEINKEAEWYKYTK